MKEFFLKKFGDLPVWAWGLIAAGGIGAGILLIRWQKGTPATAANLTAQSSPGDLTTGNTGAETNSASNTVGDNGIINNPFPETNVNGQQIPILPPGYQPVTDGSGNIIGYAPTSTSTGTTPSGGFTATARTIRSKTPVDSASSSRKSVPFLSSPGGKALGSIPFGASVQQTAAVLSGPINTSANGNYSSSQWYPVTYNGQSGFVNAIDIVGSGVGGTLLNPLTRKATGLS